MSYLIALYVYYHGDNLGLFGITKGARDEDLDNSGLKRPEEIDPNLVDSYLIEFAKKREQQERDVHKFENDMRAAEKESQMKTYQLQKAGLVKNTIFDSTPDYLADEFDQSGEVSLDLF